LTNGTVYGTTSCGEDSGSGGSGAADPQSIRFADLAKIVTGIGYTFRRQKGLHRIYTAPGLPLITLQPERSMAKRYRVEQVLEIIDRYKIEVK
jgi:predicted RNA binding protein YcfA (HicA-like mRNA interferase family)